MTKLHTCHAFRSDNGTHNRLTARANGKILNKFEKTGLVTDIVKSVHLRFACSTSNIHTLKKSFSRCSQELGLSSSVL